MKIEDKITELRLAADELRPLSEDDERRFPLASIIDKINSLRALQAKGQEELDDEPARRGRPPKDKP